MNIEQIDLLNFAHQLTCFLLIVCGIGVAWILFDLIERKILVILHRRHYHKYGKCLMCDHIEATKHIPGYDDKHRIGCWKNGEPYDA